MSEYLGPYLLGPNDTPENGIYTGDARELAKAIPDESVDLVFTDPVYDRIDDYRWLAETAARVLKRAGNLLVFCAHHRQASCASILLTQLDECPILEHRVIGPRGRLFPWRLVCNVLPVLWFSKGATATDWQSLQVDSYLRSRRGHNWGKNEDMILYRIERMTQYATLVFDPFTGGGTVPAVCKMLGRRYLAFEIDPETAELARERVRNTQPPLFVPEPEQLQLV
jgi:hypothetical protein